jgi:YHS domain-containing protein
MKNSVRIVVVAATLAIVATLSFLATASGDDAGPRDIPAPFAPFEYLIGRWNGHGVPKDNPAQKFRGWTETHSWAWKFAKGKPIGLAVTIEGGKILSAGALTYDPVRKVYRLEGIEPGPTRTALAFEGVLDKTGKYLVLDHTETGGKPGKSKGTMRLSLWPNANFIRYTMAHDLKEPGSVQFTRLIEVGLTRDGESLAGAASGSEAPKCIVTGGAANMTMSFQGRTFPICCTGCRDEFNENPEKYIKKASLMAAQAGKIKSGRPAASGVGRFEDAFANDVVESPSQRKPASDESSKIMTKAEPAPDSKAAGATTSTARTGSKPDDDRAAVAKQFSRAASLLKLGQNLEKSGKTSAALDYYRRVVKDFAKTPSAKTAAERIKALGLP